ncbi:hypothetical protein BJX65DRAFT_18166 [Aspergillus insuetus]
MTENIKHTFVNYDLSHPRPTQAQRQTVSAFIGKHFRNRSAPARRAQPAPYLDDRRPLYLPPRPSTRADRGQVFRQWRMRRSIKEGGKQPPQETGAASEIPKTSSPRSINGNLLPRPVVECLVPGYPTEHRQKIFHTLDFLTYYLIPRVTHWGTGPNPSMRCWMQMICGDITLFDSVAVWAHGVRTTTLEDNDTPNVTVLWHMARASKGLQAKISTEKVAVWTSNETILATFYLMDGAAKFGSYSEFRAHCLGFLQMMRLRDRAVSTRLEDLYVMQAAALVEGTEMASRLRLEMIQDGHQPFSMRMLNLRYPLSGLQPDEALQVEIDNLPVGFRDLAVTGNLSIGFILLLKEQFQQPDNIMEAERQTEGIRKAWLLANQSHNAVEELACLGVVAFITWHSAQIKFFPERSLLDRVRKVGRQVGSLSQAGPSCYRELRAWVVLTSAEIASTVGATQKQHARDMMLELLVEERWIGSWSDLEGVVKGHLWNTKALAVWKTYWMSYHNLR